MRQSQIGIIGAPVDLGAGRRGVDMGPSAIRVARLNQRLERLGDQEGALRAFQKALSLTDPGDPQREALQDRIEKLSARD